MSDCEGTGFCRKCNTDTDFNLSGSGKKGSCIACGQDREFKRNEINIYYHQDAEETFEFDKRDLSWE